MAMLAYLFLGSICSGKSTTIRKLASISRSKGFNVISIEVNINHGLAYLVTRFIVSLSRYRYIGNYYLTLRFNNPHVFCKYLPLMMFLDLLFIPIKYATILLRIALTLITRKIHTVILIDEYYPNAIVDYGYFVNELCEKEGLVKTIYKLFYKVAISYTISTLKKIKSTVVVFISANPLVAVELWHEREHSRIYDFTHFHYRTIGILIISNTLKEYSHALFFRVNDPRKDEVEILKSLIQDIMVKNHA
jgi:hypothetical protein